MNNVVALLEKRVKQSSTQIALTYKDKGRWHYYRWQDVQRISNFLAAGLAKMGIVPGDRVGIIANTRAEWFLSDLAVMIARGISVPIYPNINSDETSFVINNSECKVLILENAHQWKRWQKLKPQCPGVQSVIIMRPEGLEKSDDWQEWNTILNSGSEYLHSNPNWLSTTVSQVQEDDIVTIPYTSGTTGFPKGVVLTHRQIMSELQDVFTIMPVDDRDTTLTFLPLSHILGRVETLGSVQSGYRLAFAESTDKLKENLREVKPTFIIGVPRIFEKIHTGINMQMNQSKAIGRPLQKVIDFSSSIARRVEKGLAIPWSLSVPHRLVHSLLSAKIKEAFGGQLRFAVSGGAPLDAQIAEFFFAVGIPVYEGYGLTETTAGVCFNSPLNYKLGTVGPALADVELKIADDGEILIKSAKVMKEYYKNPEATEKVFQNGYFCTGDIGEIDSEGFLRITDRKKDLIKTAGGKYVAPQKLAGLLKRSSFVSNVHIHGDKKRYIVALLALNEEAIRQYANEKEIPFSTYEELLNNRQIQQLSKSIVADANAELASFESVKKFRVLPHDFTIETGELTPSLKVKRKFCDEKYKSLIDEMYSG